MQLSVVVISINSPVLLERCLAGLQEVLRDTSSETLVVRRSSLPGLPSAAETGPPAPLPPDFRWLEAGEADNVPAQFARGVAESRGEIVALLEDDCLVDPGWAKSLLAAHRSRQEIAIGGPVEPGPYRRSRDWAVYFCEYGRFLRPFNGRSKDLPVNNVSYKRERLADFLADSPTPDGQTDSAEFHAAFVHQRMLAAGLGLWAAGRMGVRILNAWPRSYFFSIPFFHGKGYAGKRLAGVTSHRKLAYAAASPLLPAILIRRIWRRVYSKDRLRLELLAALPWIATFYFSWAAGEMSGALFGQGHSLDRWK